MKIQAPEPVHGSGLLIHLSHNKPFTGQIGEQFFLLCEEGSCAIWLLPRLSRRVPHLIPSRERACPRSGSPEHKENPPFTLSDRARTIFPPLLFQCKVHKMAELRHIEIISEITDLIISLPLTGPLGIS